MDLPLATHTHSHTLVTSYRHLRTIQQKLTSTNNTKNIITKIAAEVTDTSLLLSICGVVVITVLSTASIVDNPLVIGALLLAGFVMLMLLVAIAYFVIKFVFFSFSTLHTT